MVEQQKDEKSKKKKRKQRTKMKLLPQFRLHDVKLLLRKVSVRLLPSTPKQIRMIIAREPSSSPAPAPPSQAFMIEGLDKDDKYVMVEDEFEAVAKAFTRHLHHAEYSRLKKLAREQNAQTLSSIMRPVNVRTKLRPATKRMKQQQSNTKMQRAAIEGLLDEVKAAAGNTGEVESNSDSDSTGDDPWVGTSLHGLMASPNHSQKSLLSLVDIQSNTRAAAGYSRTVSKPSHQSWPIQSSQPARIRHSSQKQIVEDLGSTTEEDDDDLDGPVVRHTINSEAAIAPSSSLEDNISKRSHGKDPPVQSRSIKSSSPPRIQRKTIKPPSNTSSSYSAFSRDAERVATATIIKEVSFDDYPVPTQLRQGTSSGFKRCVMDPRSESSKEKLERKDSANLNEVPTFLL
jgi:hypothetical protein